ncbi:isochorismatase family protein [Pseudomonas sp.]|uniref:isochorismatase family protein n=1 Tax=Pseudomonas sp. TaxID=306 RepID=UPI003D6E4B07
MQGLKYGHKHRFQRSAARYAQAETAISCFLGTDLAQQLTAAQISEWVIAGIKTPFCVDTTCRVIGFPTNKPRYPSWHCVVRH